MAQSSAALPSSAAAVAAVGGAPGQLQEGQIKQAFAVRVKYQVGTGKTKLPLKSLVVHPMNRSGVYPNGGAVQHLGCQLMRLGFVEEIANCEGVVMQEVPGPEQFDMPASPFVLRGADGKYLPYLDHNRKQCENVPQLRRCFPVDHTGPYGTLSRSRLLLILLSLSNGGQ